MIIKTLLALSGITFFVIQFLDTATTLNISMY